MKGYKKSRTAHSNRPGQLTKGFVNHENVCIIPHGYKIGKGVSMDEKIQTGLRLPEKRYEELKNLANRAGISVNATILMLLDIGLSAVNHGIREEAHSHSHIPKCSGGQ